MYVHGTYTLEVPDPHSKVNVAIQQIIQYVGIPVPTKVCLGTSLAVQWLRLLNFHCRGDGFYPWLANKDAASHRAQPKIIKNEKKKKN